MTDPALCNAPRDDGSPDGGFCNHPPGHLLGHSWVEPGPAEDHGAAAPADSPDDGLTAPGEREDGKFQDTNGRWRDSSGHFTSTPEDA